jgi:hypothetical protein
MSNKNRIMTEEETPNSLAMQTFFMTLSKRKRVYVQKLAEFAVGLMFRCFRKTLHVVYASETTLAGVAFLFLYQRVGRRAQETVNKMQRAIDMPQTALAWKQLLRVTPAQWRRSQPAPEELRFCAVAVTNAYAYWASTSADDLPIT